MGADLLVRPRLSRIVYNGRFFDYPLKALNALVNLGPIETVRCMASYATARLFPTRNPKTFEDWVTNQFGARLFRVFFKTYTEKIWGMSSKEISADWAAQRIKGLSLFEAIKNSFLPTARRNKGTVVKTLIDEFRYPRLGPGQLWERVTEIVEQHGSTVLLGRDVIQLRHSNNQITGIVTRDSLGDTTLICGSSFISTMPMRELVRALDPPAPDNIRRAAERLKYRDFLTVVLIVDKADMFPDNWIYLHDPHVVAGRIQNFKNWSPEMVPEPHKTCLGLEYFCFEGDPLWASSDEDLVNVAKEDLMRLQMCSREQIVRGVVVRQKKAYPVYDDEYKTHVGLVRDYLEQHATNLQLVGRNGMHHYNNQDHSMMTALCAARNIALHAELDPWNVNTDAEYHEGIRHGHDASGRQQPRRSPA